LLSARRITRPSSFGIAGFNSVTDFGVSRMIAARVDTLVSPLNGRSPVAIS
jgi:hypothetical protein